MDVIPAEIAIEIFSRVPAETILECKSVCKTWQNLLSLDKKFTDMHFRRRQDLLDHHEQKVNLGLIFLRKSENSSGHELYYGEYDETISNNNTSTDDDGKEECSIPNTLRLINHPLVRSQKKYDTCLLVGSCNGLICLAEPRMYGLNDPIHICNPITSIMTTIMLLVYIVVLVTVQKPTSTRLLESYIAMMLVQQIYKVYTLGGGSGWRNKGLVTYTLYEQHGFFANGAIHWLDMNAEETIIMAFNLLDERFHVLPSAPFSCVNTFIIGSYGEWLCVVNHDSGECLDIWTFKKTSSGTTTSITVGNNEYESWSWCKEFSIDLEGSSPWDYVPVAFTKTGLLVLWYADLSIVSEKGTFYSYNPKTATWKTLGTMDFLEVIPHMNSFVSLKALGETTCKKRKKRSVPSSSVKVS